MADEHAERQARGSSTRPGRAGGREWERIRATAYECPRIEAGFLEEERRAMGDRHFQQEYLCEFTDAAGSVFDSDTVERAMDSGIEPLRIR